MLRCEVPGCFNQPVEKAHIKSRGVGGSNKPHNIINLCVDHHRRGNKAFHLLGVWSFAKLFGFTERFEAAYDAEIGIVKTKRIKQFTKTKERENIRAKRVCPHCKRAWSKGVILKKGASNE